MPSLYAHYYFADKCVDKLPDELKKIVGNNRQFYDLGSSAGDLLFFYKPYKRNDVRSYGSQLHRENFIEQMARFRQSAVGSCHEERDIAYLTGYFTHYVLDSVTHPYICKMEEQKVEKHFVIEMDYDRKLLIKVGENPYSNKYLRFQVNDGDTQEVLAKYLNTTPKVIKKTLKDRKLFVKIISSQNKLFRRFLEFVFKASGNKAGLDILVRNQENVNCKIVREKLDELMRVALSEVENYGEQFYEFLTAKKELSQRFDCDFYMRATK